MIRTLASSKTSAKALSRTFSSSAFALVSETVQIIQIHSHFELQNLTLFLGQEN